MLKKLTWLIVAFVLIGQQSFFRAIGFHPAPGWEALVPGLAIFGAALVLSWAAELAQMEIPQSLALAFLALMATVPEYAVDIYFSFTAGNNQQYVSWVTANMTGANRLLIGLGWPVVLLAFYFTTRKKQIQLEKEHRLEIIALLAATVYAFLLPIKGNISLLDSLVFIAIFIFYITAAARSHHREPELEGPAELFSKGSRPYRCFITVIFFLLAGATIYSSARPFAEGLLDSGRAWGIDEFILVQWLAPLASESPEFIVAIIFATRALPGASFGTIISSTVNQWTLLIASLPIAFALGGGSLLGIKMDNRQMEEVFLTAAQSLFAVFVLANFRFSLLEALVLLGLFSTQLLIPLILPVEMGITVRIGYGLLYLVLAVLLILLSFNRRKAVLSLIRPSRAG